jgi:NTP pyrophosphatase (non-canonical NTP hydrolase)
MNFDDYQHAACRTMNSCDGDRKQVMANMALGLAGETGELVDVIKKDLFHGVTMTQVKFIDEAGDVLWYLAAMCKAAGVTLEQVAAANVRKLQARYPDGFVQGGGQRAEPAQATSREEVNKSFGKLPLPPDELLRVFGRAARKDLEEREAQKGELKALREENASLRKELAGMAKQRDDQVRRKREGRQVIDNLMTGLKKADEESQEYQKHIGLLNEKLKNSDQTMAQLASDLRHKDEQLTAIRAALNAPKRAA